MNWYVSSPVLGPVAGARDVLGGMDERDGERHVDRDVDGIRRHDSFAGFGTTSDVRTFTSTAPACWVVTIA